MKSPVILIIFNRPQSTLRVFERIREARPQQLFVAADGPRSDVPSDQETCTHVRQIVDMVDWECEVHTHSFAIKISVASKRSAPQLIGSLNTWKNIIFDANYHPLQDVFVENRDVWVYADSRGRKRQMLGLL